MEEKHKYHLPVTEFARKDFNSLNKNLTVDEALRKIREEGIGERIVYFYVIDDEEKLVGVLPTRRILTAALEKKIEEIMVNRVAALPSSATVYDACEFFVTYKFLAFPVINEERKLIGIVDVNLFTEELLSLDPDIDDRQQVDDVFQRIGFSVNEIKNASPFKAWRIRLPWLLATVTSGTVCAILTGMFETTLAESLIIVFFFTLVLGLGESVSIQAMTVAIQSLHSSSPSLKWYLKSFMREAKTAFLLGMSCAAIVAVVVVLWKKDFTAAIVIGLSVMLVQQIASAWGISVPTILHKAKLDPKIAAGPITLALTDICTILMYFGLAAMIL
jgi:magnesium transporter